MTRPLPDQPAFRLAVGRSGDRTVVTVGGDVDLATAEDFAAAVRRELAGAPVLVDLRDVAFMDSSGIRVLDGLLRDVDREGWALALHPELAPPVRRVLEITGMLAVLPFDREPADRA